MRLTANIRVNLDVKYLQRAAATGLKFGVSEGAGLIESEAKLLVPVVTGRLRDAIHTETLVETPTRVEMAVLPAHEASTDVGFDPPYARRIEYGFVGQDRLGRHYNQAAQPYMRPAADSQRDAALKAVKDGVYSSLEDASNAVARRRNR